MVILLPHQGGRWASGHDLCPSIPEKVRSVVMAMPILLLEGSEGGQEAMVSASLLLRKRRVGVKVTLVPHRKGRWASGHDLCLF